MKIEKYKICGGGVCESLAAVARDIQKSLDLENVRIDPDSGKVSYDNPRHCHVDEQLLEEAASHPGRHIEFEKCD